MFFGISIAKQATLIALPPGACAENQRFRKMEQKMWKKIKAESTQV